MKGKIKSAFAFKKTEDGWNPHIVRVPPVLDYKAEEKLKHDISTAKLLSDGGHKEYTEELAQLMSFEGRIKEFKDKWQGAQDILRGESKRKGMFPLAYRIEPVLSDKLTVDPIDGDKFGGIPDLRYDWPFVHKKEEGLDKLIARTWPRCSCCHEHMNYLCGITLGELAIPIHLLTRRNLPKEGGQYDNPPARSGLGFDGNVGADFASSNLFWNVFSCKHAHFDNPNTEALIFVDAKYDSDKAKLFSTEEYKKAVDEFVAKNEIKSNIPIQTVKGFNLRFDVDLPGREFNPDWLDELELDEKYPEIFGREGYYQFFGKPRSQQTERRPFCSNSYFNQHRLAPILNWNEHEGDFTNQLYGCLRCSREFAPIFCKKDGSCT